MIKEKIKNEKGVSLISLAIVIVVLVILTNVILYNVKDNLKIGKLKAMQNDIVNLRDKVASYYAENGKIPASIKYTNIDHIKAAGVISEVADAGDFFVIDLSALENLTLNYGKDFEIIKQKPESANDYQDVYVINEASHNVFYVAGITVDTDVFYTDYTSDEVDLATVDLRYVENVKIPEGFYYVGGTKNTGIVISDVQGDDLANTKQGNQFVWVPVENINDFHTIEGYYNGSLQSYLSKCSEPYTNGYSTEISEYNSMKKSIEANHGFYIGRYKAGKVDNKVVVKKNVPVYNNIKWGTSMTDETGGAVELSKNFATEKGYTSVTSTLCYGVQWDAALQFIDNNYITGTCESNSYLVDSTDKGHYASGSPINTGSNDNYAVKNIYDMAGNVFEWTMEAYNTDNRVLRGGVYDGDASEIPASRRGFNYPSYASGGIGFRIALYLNNEEQWSPVYDQEGIYQDKNGDTAYIPEGFQVSEVSGQNTIDDGLVIQDSTGNYHYVWIEVPKSIYGTATSSEDYENIEKDMQVYTKDYRKENYTDTWYSQEQHGFASKEDYDSYKRKMLKDVYEKGGFWIAQYEMGTQTIRTSSNVDNTTPVSKEGMYPYNWVTCKQAQQLANDINFNQITNSLPFGIQWDLVMKFIEVKGAKTQIEINKDSTSWGNYLDSNFDIIKGAYSIDGEGKNFTEVEKIYTKSNVATLFTTGVTNRNKVLNIYDLAGNIYEWTLERTEKFCCGRGGYPLNNGNLIPASYRGKDAVTNRNYYIGFRTVLINY